MRGNCRSSSEAVCVGDAEKGDGSAPQEYLKQSFNYHYSFIGPVVGILLAFTVFFAALAVLTLRFGKFQKR